MQHPANDENSDIITTHFDYHSIDGNLLKLDILGHDDPTMIRMLEDLTGLDAKEIPLDQKDVMSLFAGTEALGIKPEDIGGCKLGCPGRAGVRYGFRHADADRTNRNISPIWFVSPDWPMEPTCGWKRPGADPGRKGDHLHRDLYP